jgi:hypothetical protein
LWIQHPAGCPILLSAASGTVISTLARCRSSPIALRPVPFQVTGQRRDSSRPSRSLKGWSVYRRRLQRNPRWRERPWQYINAPLDLSCNSQISGGQPFRARELCWPYLDPVPYSLYDWRDSTTASASRAYITALSIAIAAWLASPVASSRSFWLNPPAPTLLITSITPIR